ncbi:MAG: class II fructose-bisphosphate aldolase [Enterobacterales bacterium]
MSKILDFVKPGVVTGENINKIFNFAKQHNFALPAVNCISTDSINAVLETAAQVKSPVIIQFSYYGSAFIAGKGLLNYDHKASILGAISGALHIHNVSKYYNIPVIIHTDHCSKKILPWIDKLLKFGKQYFYKTGSPLFSSHMIDLSNETLEDNIKISSNYLENMSKLNMNLEIELGCTGGEEDELDNRKLDHSKLYTQPKDVCYAYEKLSNVSQNFMIAANFGNVHGVYKNNKVKLKPKILYESQKFVSKKFKLPNNFLNLVFHGGSGVNPLVIQEAIRYGVVKINIDTDIQWASWNGILNFYKKNKQFLHEQISSIENNFNKPNKKFYDPRSWIRYSQLSIINRLKEIFFKLNAVNIL